MVEESQKPNPTDLAREQIEKALNDDNFNGVKVLIYLDQLEGALHEAGNDPINTFNELASKAKSAKDRIPTDMLQGKMFDLKATNYLRTASMLQEQKAKVLEENIPQTTALVVTSADTKSLVKRTSRQSSPTNTSTLSATSYPKS